MTSAVKGFLWRSATLPYDLDIGGASVRPPVCLSQAGTVWRLIGSRDFHHCVSRGL